MGGLTAAMLAPASAFAGVRQTSGPSGHRAPGFGHLELVLLGTRSGPSIDPYRTGISSALVVDGSVYLVDCGLSSVSQFARAGLSTANLKNIFITHLHADHVGELYNFFLFGALSSTLGGPDLPTSGVGVYGPGPAGGLPASGGSAVATVSPNDPTPGLRDLMASSDDAFAYSTNVLIRGSGMRDIRALRQVHEISVPDVGASYLNTAPKMSPFLVMEDDKVRVTAILVPHGSVFPSFAYRFDTEYGSVTFSGDTSLTPNIPTLANRTDLLVHEALNVEGVDLPPVLKTGIASAHTPVQQVGQVAQASHARHLVLSHIIDMAPDGSPISVPKWVRWARQGYSGRVTVGNDLQRIPV
jgi:ribonuclease BN (tRNA processing enzyme)